MSILAFTSIGTVVYNLSVVGSNIRDVCFFVFCLFLLFLNGILTAVGRWRRSGVRTATDVSYRRDGGVFNWTEEEEGVCHIEVIFSFLKGGGYPYI